MNINMKIIGNLDGYFTKLSYTKTIAGEFGNVAREAGYSLLSPRISSILMGSQWLGKKFACTPRRPFSVLLIILFILCRANIATSFIVPGSGRGHAVGYIMFRKCSMDRLYFVPSPSPPRKSTLLIRVVNREDSEDESNAESKNIPILNRVGKFGSKVMSSVKGERTSRIGGEGNRNNAPIETAQNRKQTSEKKKWGRRLGSSKVDNNDAKVGQVKGGKKSTSGFMGIVGNVKRNLNVEKSSELTRDSNPFEKSKFSDPFQSEVALASELRKQKAIEDYISGDATEIPKEFLLENSNDGSLAIEQALGTIDGSLTFIREKLSAVRLNENDESNNLFLTPSQEKKRLNQIRADLETQRRKLVAKGEKRKKEEAAKDRAQQEKIRSAAAKANKDKEGQEEYDRIFKTRTNQAKNILQASKEVDSQLRVDTNAYSVDSNNVEPIRGRVGNFVDGVMGNTQLAFGSAWQTLRSTPIGSAFQKKEKDEWIPVCPKTRISPGEVYPVVAAGLDLLIIGSKDGTKVFCVSNKCPHLGTPLETGIVERRACPKQFSSTSKSNSLSTDDDTKEVIDDGSEDCVVCPLHKTAFSLDTGEVRGEWCPYPPVLGKFLGTANPKNNLTTFEMRTRGKNLEIKINSKLEDD